MAEGGAFAFSALTPEGRSVSGLLTAADPEAAFAALKAQGLTPTRLKPTQGSRSLGGSVKERELGALLSELAALLAAGSDIRTALSILKGGASRSPLQQVLLVLNEQIGGGGSIDEAFEQALGGRFEFVAALVRAGELSGDLPGGLQRASQMIEARLQARDKLVAAMAYPAFVLLSSVVALVLILLFVVPSLEPLARSTGGEPPLAMRLLIGASRGFRQALPVLGIAGGVVVVLLALSALSGALPRFIDTVLMKGPARRLAAAIVFGGFAVSLGSMLAAGAPVSDALRLAQRTVRSLSARKALAKALDEVRDGHALSTALGHVSSMPVSITRLAMIGEHAGASGPMLQRAGGFEEAWAYKVLERRARMLGPVLIVILGAVVGLLMVGMLSAVSGLGRDG